MNEIFELYPSKTKIAIESMAGKGTEIGKTLDELALILSLINDKSRVGVCLDTCHLHDAGYDLANTSSFLHLVNEKIGLENVLVIHLNDSKNERGAKKDRHENIGYGYIGFNTLYEYVYHPLLTNIPKILETPYINEKPPYKEEIAMIKNKVFNKMLK